MAVIFHDTFTEASDGPLASHTPGPVGTSWTASVAPPEGFIRITAFDDFVQPSEVAVTAGLALMIADPGPPGVNVTAEFTFHNSPPGESGSGCALVLGYVDNDNYYIGGTMTSATSTDKRVYKRVAGVNTQLATADSGIATGDTLSFTRSGTNLILRHNGTTVINVSDGSLVAAGKCGFIMGGIMGGGGMVNRNWRIDNFLVTTPAGRHRTRRTGRQVKQLLAGETR